MLINISNDLFILQWYGTYALKWIRNYVLLMVYITATNCINYCHHLSNDIGSKYVSHKSLYFKGSVVKKTKCNFDTIKKHRMFTWWIFLFLSSGRFDSEKIIAICQ